MTLRMMVLFGVGIVFSGCDMFSTREAEEPGRSGSTFSQPVEPSITIRNLQDAISERNRENYLRCLADTFETDYVFVPTLSAQTVYDFSRWDKSSEDQYFRNLAAASTREHSHLDFFEQDTSRSATSFLFRAKYYLEFPHTRPQLSSVAEGRLEFTIERSSRDNWWYITRWVDYPDTSQTTWSHLKGAFLN